MSSGSTITLLGWTPAQWTTAAVWSASIPASMKDFVVLRHKWKTHIMDEPVDHHEGAHPCIEAAIMEIPAACMPVRDQNIEALDSLHGKTVSTNTPRQYGSYESWAPFLMIAAIDD